jgi:hypothetical protein
MQNIAITTRIKLTKLLLLARRHQPHNDKPGTKIEDQCHCMRYIVQASPRRQRIIQSFKPIPGSSKAEKLRHMNKKQATTICKNDHGLSEVRRAGDDTLVGFPASVDPLTVDIDGLRQRMSLGGVALHAGAARRHDEWWAFLAEDLALVAARVAAEGAGEVRLQIRCQLLGLCRQLGGPRLPLPQSLTRSLVLLVLATTTTDLAGGAACDDDGSRREAWSIDGLKGKAQMVRANVR